MLGRLALPIVRKGLYCNGKINVFSLRNNFEIQRAAAVSADFGECKHSVFINEDFFTG